MTPVAAPDGPRLPSFALVAAYVVVAAVFASAMPLLAYAGSLALFGAAHVLTELRYVDGRFGDRLRSGGGILILALLALAVGLRALSVAGAIDARGEYLAELGVVATMVFVVVPELGRHPGRAAFAFLAGATIATGSAVAPWTTVVILSILHNATPVGFLAERFAGTPRRRPVLLACAVAFLAVPIAIASGLGSRGLSAVGLFAPDLAFASAGTLASQLRVFVPAAWLDDALAPSIFAASAYLQLLHYGVVIGVLPRLLTPRGSDGDRPIAPWPGARRLAVAIAGVSVVAAFAFVRDFGATRTSYGILASAHAWIELPLLLWARAPRPRAGRGADARAVPA